VPRSGIGLNELLAVAIRRGGKMKRLAGGTILLIVFGGLFAWMVADIGVGETAKLWTLATTTALFVLLGVSLIVDDG